MIKSEFQKGENKVSDLGYLSETMGGNKKLINEIIDVFLKQAPEELSALNNAVEKTDYATIKNISHTMKSSVSIMGISSVASVLKELEELAKSGTYIEKIKLLNNNLNTICNRAIEEIKKEKSNYI